MTLKPTHTRLLPAASLAGLARSASTADLLSMVLQLPDTCKYTHADGWKEERTARVAKRLRFKQSCVAHGTQGGRWNIKKHSTRDWKTMQKRGCAAYFRYFSRSMTASQRRFSCGKWSHCMLNIYLCIPCTRFDYDHGSSVRVRPHVPTQTCSQNGLSCRKVTKGVPRINVCFVD